MIPRWLAASSTVLMLTALPGAAAQRAQGVERRGSELRFEYQFWLGEGRPVAVPVGLASGDRFVVRLKATESAFACLFVTDGGGAYTLMRAEGSEPCARVGRTWSVLPDGDAVMRLDDREGVERIYLIVSPSPVVEVEDLPEDGRVSESWLVALRDRYGRNTRRGREVTPDSVRVWQQVVGVDPPVSVEDLTFNYRPSGR